MDTPETKKTPRKTSSRDVRRGRTGHLKTVSELLCLIGSVIHYSNSHHSLLLLVWFAVVLVSFHPTNHLVPSGRETLSFIKHHSLSGETRDLAGLPAPSCSSPPASSAFSLSDVVVLVFFSTSFLASSSFSLGRETRCAWCWTTLSKPSSACLPNALDKHQLFWESREVFWVVVWIEKKAQEPDTNHPDGWFSFFSKKPSLSRCDWPERRFTSWESCLCREGGKTREWKWIVYGTSKPDSETI